MYVLASAAEDAADCIEALAIRLASGLETAAAFNELSIVVRTLSETKLDRAVGWRRAGRSVPGSNELVLVRSRGEPALMHGTFVYEEGDSCWRRFGEDEQMKLYSFDLWMPVAELMSLPEVE